MITSKPVAILGSSEAFHGLVARNLFGENADLLECPSFDQIIDRVEQGQAEFGIMAWENSLAGIVTGNPGRLASASLIAIAEIFLPIRLHLAAIAGSRLDAIRELRSHPMAFRQCKRFLSSHPDWTLTEADDTATAAREVAQSGDQSLAALTGVQAARRYGLDLLDSHLEDESGNNTRFLVLKKPEKHRLNKIHEPVAKAIVVLEYDISSSVLALFIEHLYPLGAQVLRMDEIQHITGPSGCSTLLEIYFDQSDQWSALLTLLEAMLPNHKVIGFFEKGKIIEE